MNFIISWPTFPSWIVSSVLSRLS